MNPWAVVAGIMLSGPAREVCIRAGIEDAERERMAEIIADIPRLRAENMDLIDNLNRAGQQNKELRAEIEWLRSPTLTEYKSDLLIEALRNWRRADHADALVVHRNQVIAILEKLDRLRAENERLDNPHWAPKPADCPEGEATNLTLRLRAENASIKAWAVKSDDENDALRAENERLQEKLDRATRPSGTIDASTELDRLRARVAELEGSDLRSLAKIREVDRLRAEIERLRNDDDAKDWRALVAKNKELTARVAELEAALNEAHYIITKATEEWPPSVREKMRAALSKSGEGK